jgi:hypothetical protein
MRSSEIDLLVMISDHRYNRIAATIVFDSVTDEAHEMQAKPHELRQ